MSTSTKDTRSSRLIPLPIIRCQHYHCSKRNAHVYIDPEHAPNDSPYVWYCKAHGDQSGLRLCA